MIKMHKKKVLFSLLALFSTWLLAVSCRTTTTLSTPVPSLSIEPHDALIYYSDREDDSSGFALDGFGGLYLFDLLTKEEIYLTEGRFLSQHQGFSWSPITRKLLYTEWGDVEADGNDLKLYSLDLNGNAKQLTGNNSSDSHGRWSPDGQTIAFWSNRSDNSWVYLMDPDGSNVRPIFDSEHEFIFGDELAWSPDSQKLAISTINPNGFLPSNLVIVELESKSILPSLSDNRIRSNFSWSHDSNQLVYLSDPVAINAVESVYTSMYILNPNTQEEALIAEFEAIGTPLWSPTEDVIAFSATTSEEPDNINIYLINSDGSELKQLTDSGAYRVASWSQDGKKLAIEAIGRQLADHEIYTLNVESGTLEQVTDNEVFDAFPVWIEIR
jgi:Tol biopolymer transport system component